MDERKRDSMIAYLRHRMEEFGIRPEDLAAVLASEPAAQRPDATVAQLEIAGTARAKCLSG